MEKKRAQEQAAPKEGPPKAQEKREDPRVSALAAEIGGRWEPRARLELARLIVIHGSSAPAYNADVPPAVVIDAAASFHGDPAEIVFYQQVARVDLKFSDELWKRVPAGFGRQRLRSAHEEFLALPRAVWASQPAYRQYRKGFLSSYRTICAKVGFKECRAFLARLMIGYTDEELRGYAKAALAEEAQASFKEELVREADSDLEPLRWPHGYAVVPELKDLVGRFRGAGFDVWIVSPTAEPILVQASDGLGVHESRSLAIRQGTERDRLDGVLKEPIPVRGGAVEAVVTKLGRPPILVVGKDPYMDELMLYGSEGVRIGLGSDPALAERLPRLIIQPPFPR